MLCRVMVQTSAVVPTRVVVQILFIRSHSRLEAGSHEGYGIGYGYHLPGKGLWSEDGN